MITFNVVEQNDAHVTTRRENTILYLHKTSPSLFSH